MNLLLRVSIPLVIVAVIGVLFQANILSSILNKNTLETTVNSAKNIIEQYRLLRSYYSENVISKVKKSGTMEVGYEHKNVENQIPLPATMILDLSETLKQNHTGTQIKLYSELPFPNRSGRVLDQFQRDAIAYFKKDKDGMYIKEDLESTPRRIRVAIADKMSAQSCVNCHNSHPKSPFTNWKIGDVRGVLEVETNIEDVLKANAQVSATTWGLTSLTGVSLIVLLIFVLQFVIQPIKTTTRELSQATKDIFQISEALSHTSNDLKDSANRQASSFTETSAAIEAVSTKVQDNTQFANLANQSSENLLKLSQTAQSSMNDLSIAMNDILKANQKIDNVVKIIEEIGTKTEIIDDIVFKTQLLSFNASVEAERAGENGRGFAVVAQEVGNLAQISGKAATEIANIVKHSIRESAAVATDNRDRVKKGDAIATSSREQLHIVLNRVQEIISSINQIALASREQAEQVSQITEAVGQLSHVADQTSKNAEITSSSSGMLSEKSRALLIMISRMEDVMNGEKNTRAS